jgi:UDP-N-acetylmuramate dehydrogenase
MALHSTFRIGGPAEAFVRPADADSAAALLAAAHAEAVPLFVLGGGANILVGDGGIRGIVLDTSAIRSIRVEAGSTEPDDGAAHLFAGAGLTIDELCLDALAKGLGGLEDFYGMPGTVGGAVYMNARCYEREMSQVLAYVVSAAAGASKAEGGVARRPVAARDWSYKRSPFQAEGSAAGELILEAAFRLTRLSDEGAARTARVMRERRADREAKGHYRLPSAGSVFKNDRSFGAPTGRLLDGLGLRGKRIGDAMVSTWHANIFVNAGSSSAADMRSLIELARSEARERLGIELESEVLMIGEF